MLDTKYIKDNIEEVAKKLKYRGYNFDIESFKNKEDQRKNLQERTQELQEQRNTLSKQIGKLKAKGESADEVLSQVEVVNTELKQIEKTTKNTIRLYPYRVIVYA